MASGSSRQDDLEIIVAELRVGMQTLTDSVSSLRDFVKQDLQAVRQEISDAKTPWPLGAIIASIIAASSAVGVFTRLSAQPAQQQAYENAEQIRDLRSSEKQQSAYQGGQEVYNALLMRMLDEVDALQMEQNFERSRIDSIDKQLQAIDRISPRSKAVEE